MPSMSLSGPRNFCVAGCTRQLVQCFPSRVQYKRYSSELLDDCSPAASLQARTLRRARKSLTSCVISRQGPAYSSDSANFDWAPADDVSKTSMTKQQDDDGISIVALIALIATALKNPNFHVSDPPTPKDTAPTFEDLGNGGGRGRPLEAEPRSSRAAQFGTNAIF